jgi:fibro-slime domain-containing protein
MLRTLIVSAALSVAAISVPAAAAGPEVPLAGPAGVAWFTVQAGGSGDFQTYCCSDFRSDLVLEMLGPNGLPVYNVASVGPQTIKGVDAVTGEIQWWSNGVTNGGDTVTFTGFGLTSIPFSDTSLFPVNGAGSGNGRQNGFQTAVFGGTLNLDSRSVLRWTMSADDDAWVFVNGKLLTGLGGVHPVSASPLGTVGLNAGSHDVRVFFADRHTTQSSLSFSATIQAVPEPATWAMLISGFGLVGWAARRRRNMVHVAA